MGRRARDLALSLAALGAGTAAAIAVSGAESAGAAATASINAVDFAWENPDTGGSSATIDPGGTVTFGYPTGANFHNVDFSGLQPTSCTQTAGTNLGAVPPLPAAPQGPGWAGTCGFDTPGTYGFVCQAHAFMTGQVVVVDPTATTTGPTGTTTTPTGTTTTPTNTTPTTGGTPSPRVSVARRQRGVVVRGAVTTPAGRSRIVVTAFVSNRALAAGRPTRARRVRVGSLNKRSAGTGRTSFAVRLNAAARRALHRRGRLAVSLRIVVTPPVGSAVTKTVAVALRYA